MPQSHDRRVMATRNAAPSKSRLESLPAELIENIAEYLDTRSHKQLRLSSRYLDWMSTYTFGARLKSSTFFFTRTSMEKLALLSESTRWTKYVKSLEIKDNVLRPSERTRWLDFWRSHHEETYRDRSRRVPAWELCFKQMPDVQTLNLELEVFFNLDPKVSLHCLIHKLYAALPNLTTLELSYSNSDLPYAGYDDSKRAADFAWAPLSPMPNLRRLSITCGLFPSTTILADIIRAQKDSLRAVLIFDTRCDGSWLEVFQVLRHELPLLEDVVFSNNWSFHHRTFKFNWWCGTSDFGHNAQPEFGQKSIWQRLDKMIDALPTFE